MSNQLKIYIIHYTKLEERKRNIQSILDPFSIDYEFIESFDKEELKQLDRKEYYEDSKIKFDEKVTLWKERANKYYTLSEAEISCTIKHIEALKKIRDGDHEFNLILEDDAIPKYYNFLKYINPLIRKPHNWDVLLIGEGMGKKFRNSKIGLRRFNPFKLMFKIEHPATNCLEAYIVKKSKVDLILDQLIPFNLIIDWELAHQFFIKNMNIYWSKKSIFQQGSKNNLFKSELR